MPVIEADKIVLLRTKVGFTADADFVLTQNIAGFADASSAIGGNKDKNTVVITVFFTDADGVVEPAGRGSFDMAPILQQDGRLADGTPETGAVGGRRYVLQDVKNADKLGVRLYNISAPGTATQMMVYAEGMDN